MVTNNIYTYRCKKVKVTKLYTHKRNKVHRGEQLSKRNLPQKGQWLGMNMQNFGAIMASQKTHKRNNK